MTKSTQMLSQHLLRPALRIGMFVLLLSLAASATLAQTRGYVANNDDHTVTVIDTATFSAVATVPVGLGPTDVAVTPNGRFAYVVNQQSNSVSVISAATNTVVATIPVGSFPSFIAITPDGTRAYVDNTFDSLSVIDIATNTVVTSMAINNPFEIALAPSGNLGYVTHGALGNGVTVINTATNSIVTNIPIPVDAATEIAVSPNGAFLYVTCSVFGTGPKLAVIETATNTIVTFVPLPPNFSPGVAVTPDGAFVYVTNNGGGVCCGGPPLPSSVSVIDTATNTEVARVGVGTSPSAVAVTPDGAFVYVADFFDQMVSVISTANNAVVAFVPAGAFSQSIAFGTFVPEPPPPPDVDPIEALIEHVEALVAAGSLTERQGAGLLAKIQEISAKIEAGQTGATCNQLNSFIHQVNVFIGNGTLTPAEGQPLIDLANELQSDVGC